MLSSVIKLVNHEVEYSNTTRSWPLGERGMIISNHCQIEKGPELKWLYTQWSSYVPVFILFRSKQLFKSSVYYKLNKFISEHNLFLTFKGTVHFHFKFLALIQIFSCKLEMMWITNATCQKPSSKCWWIDHELSVRAAIFNPHTDRMLLKSDATINPVMTMYACVSRSSYG